MIALLLRHWDKIVAVLLVAALLGWVYVRGRSDERNVWKAREAAALQAALDARKVDESYSNGIAVAYESVAAQLRRMATVNRVEIHRETERVEYRCPLPETGRSLLNRAIAVANDGLRDPDADGAKGAGTGQPDAAVPADTSAGREGSRRTGDSLFGTDGDVR